MKLRNKKTGDIAVLNSDHNDSLADFGGQILVEANGKDFYYDTLAKFNEDWEDCNPAEPLIKDPKIRKAVRAWAEANSIGQANYSYDGNSLWFGDDEIGFKYLEHLPLELGQSYTITELCGEEEE